MSPIFRLLSKMILVSSMFHKINNYAVYFTLPDSMLKFIDFYRVMKMKYGKRRRIPRREVYWT